jgi:para-nitrobenzyl esterase
LLRLITPLLAAALLIPGRVMGEAKGPVIRVEGGSIRGRAENGVRLFAGIPYAAPPVGASRWKPPGPVAPWSSVRDATAMGPACVQPSSFIDAGALSENCLTLNVWTAAKSGQRLPVMVWIHGGAFNYGSSSQPDYNGTNLAKRGVVVVTINYRLGALGYLVHPRLSRESALRTSGNYGLLDQIAALKWVQRNIALFGGDASHVTIAGQSAGSKSVTLLLISRLAAGLFHRAIAHSGGPIIGSELLTPSFDGDFSKASKMGHDLGVKLGCDKTADVLACLRARSAQEVIKSAAPKGCVLDDDGPYFAPVFDGKVLPRDPVAAYTGGQQPDVPLILGFMRNEGYFFFKDEKNLSLARYRAFLKSRFGADADRAFALFPARTERDLPAALDQLLTATVVVQPMKFVGQSMDKKRSAAYLFEFCRRPDTAMARKLRVHHGVELAYLFGWVPASAGYDDTDRKLSSKMMSYFVNFIKSGDPNGPELVAWPAYRRTTDLHLELDAVVRTGRNRFAGACDLMSRRPPYRTGP